MSGLRFNLLIAALILILLFLQYRLWFEKGGVRDMWQLRKELGVQTQQNNLLKKQNDTLVFQIQRLQRGKDQAEARARNELGMIKKDEKFYQIVK